MTQQIKVSPLPVHIDLMKSLLKGYWGNDVWHIHDSIFDQYHRPKWAISKSRRLHFEYFPKTLRDEVKYFFAYRLVDQLFVLSSAWTYGSKFRSLADFIHQYYPKINSFADIPIDKALLEIRSYLIERGNKLHPNKSYPPVTMLKQLHNFYVQFYDTRSEFEKDVWDFRNIPGAKLNKNKTHYSLSFVEIPKVFRPLVKKYVKVRSTIRSIDVCKADIIGLRLFMQFIHQKYPEWTVLHELSRLDMEDFLVWFRQQTEQLHTKQLDYLVGVKLFLEYIQKAEYLEAPEKPINFLLLSEDFSKKQQQYNSARKYIPESVLHQLEENMIFLTPKEYIPIVALLRATGWRISDILNLRYDTCLQKTKLGWYLCGDIVKTNVKNHRVPITDEIAAVVQVVIDQTRKKSTSKTNPHKLLFVRLSGPRIGNPPLSTSIIQALNRLAKKYHIVDDNGHLYHFGNHAFRHTKAVELINNGMNLLHVQKWMAHVSPEMTLHYAEILDETMRKSWEEATKKGLFRINAQGAPDPIDLKDIENEDVIEWEYIRHNLDAVQLPLGYCMKPIKQPCPTQANPCLSCRNFCTTPDFVPQYELEIQRSKTVIERGQSIGRDIWVEKNRQMLDRLEPILQTLKGQSIHHMAGKTGREYTKGDVKLENKT